MLSLRNFRMPRPVSIGLSLALGVLSLPMVAGAAQANSSGDQLIGGFQIDGNISASVFTGGASGVDWSSSTVGSQPSASDPVNQAETSVFSGGSKELTPSGPTGAWSVSASAGQGSKDDIGNIFFYNHTAPYTSGGVTTNHEFAYFGLERAGTNGTTYYSIELNHKPDIVNVNGVQVPDRVTGDVLLSITQQGNKTWALGASAYTWDSVQQNWILQNPQPTPFYGLTNDAPIDPINSSDPLIVAGKIPTGQFAEVGVDLTLANLGSSCPNTNFSAINVRSRAAQSITSELKDYVLPFNVSIPPTCAVVKIKKVTDPATDTTTQFPFTTTLTGSINSGASSNATGTATSFTIPNNGTMADTTVLPNTTGDPHSYSVSEGSTAGWSLTSAVCTDDKTGQTVATGTGSNGALSISPDPYQNITCTYTNTQVRAPLTVDVSANPTFTRTYTWGISKLVDHTVFDTPSGTPVTANYTVGVTHNAGTDSAWALSGTVTLHNSNATTAVNTVSVTIPATFLGGSCSLAGGPTYNVPAGGSLPIAYTCSYSSAPSLPASGTLTANASWPSPQGSYTWTTTTASGATAVDFSTPTTIVNGSVNVTDTMGGSLGTVSYGDPSPTNFGYAKTFSDPAGTCTTHDNTATFTTNTTQTTGSASKSVKVCVGSDLTVAKTVTPSFTRAYTWGISKSVDNTQINVPAGSSATANYTVTVTHDPGTDSGWALSGTISVTNPNDWEDISAHVSDVYGSLCTIYDGATPVGTSAIVVAASSTKVLTYSCGFSAVPTTPFLNAATATWDSATYYTPTGSATGSAAYALDTPTIVDGSVTVTDSLKGTLGTLNYTDPISTKFTYPLVFTDQAGTCTTHDNTASFVTNTSETSGSASASVKVCVGSDLTVTKTATASFVRTFKWDITKSVDSSQINVPAGSSATGDYTVSVTHDKGTDSAWRVTGAITVTNPNDWEAITADITDAVPGGGSCTVSDGTSVYIPAGGSVTRDYTCTSFAGPFSTAAMTNTATATWDAATAATNGGSATGTADFAFDNPTIHDGSVTVSDTLHGSLGTVAYTDSSPKVFGYSLDFTDPAGECTTHDNTASFLTNTSETSGSASASVEVCVGSDLTVTKTATPSFSRIFTWGISKSVDNNSFNVAAGSTATANYSVAVTHDSGSDSGWALTGTITVHNPNVWEDITTTVTDTFPGDCTVNGGDTTITVPADSEVVLPYVCGFSLTQETPLLNTATATWNSETFATPSGSATGTASYSLEGGPTTILDGSVNVTDTMGGSLGTVSYTDPSPKTFTYSEPFSDPAGTCTTHPNTATFTTSDTATTGSAGQTVTVCVGADLNVSKTADASFTRTYHWTINKAVDPGLFSVDSGTSVTAGYGVTVAHDAGTDSAWLVTGKITVSNPNVWEAITADVTDAVPGGGTCTVTGGSQVSIPADDSVTLDYSCTSFNGPFSTESMTNTATATWDSKTAATPHGTASGTADFAFVNPRIVDGSVTVTDSLAGGTPVTLGTANYNDEVSPTVFTYSHAFTAGAPGTCATYDNTATFTTRSSETSGSSSASVQVCALSVAKHVTAINGAPATDGSRVFAGDVVQYTITVTNPGGAAGSTVLTETIPSNTTYKGPDGGAWPGCQVEGATTCTTTVDNVPAAVDGAAGSKSVTFTVQVNSPLALDVTGITNTVGSPDCVVTETTNSCTVTDPRVPSSLTVLKEDAATLQPLSGATFQLWTGTDAPSAMVGSPCTTGADGKCSTDNLEPGSYWWQETAAPAGYILPTGTAAFFPATQDVTRDNAGTSLTATTVDDLTIPLTGCDANPAACALTVKKIDSKTGKPLAGAEFGLYVSPGGDLLGRCTTGSAGTCQVSYPGNGTYYWVELKAPAGYQTPADPKVGTVTVDDQNIGTNIPATVAKDDPIPVPITGGQLPHTGIGFPVGQVVGWSLLSVLVGFLLLGLSRRRKES